jgi:hypothetical protein
MAVFENYYQNCMYIHVFAKSTKYFYPLPFLCFRRSENFIIENDVAFLRVLSMLSNGPIQTSTEFIVDKLIIINMHNFPQYDIQH